MADIPESTKLLPCPFCGGKAYPGRTTYSRPLDDARWADGSPIMETHSINCASCGGTNRGGTIGGYQTVERAIAAWNTRAAPPAMDREAVKEALFLLDRLAEFEREITDEEVFTHFNGHVSPSAARLRVCLSTLSADAIRQGEGITQFGAVVFQQVWDSFIDGGWDIEVNDLITKDALKAGLVSVEPFDPKGHVDQSGAAQPGDDFYQLTDAGRAALATPASHASDGGKA
ncbi:Lar family restriction alleviation protein [Sphingomonas sp. Marseille-Q8236]